MGKVNTRKKEEYISHGYKGILVDFNIVESFVKDWGFQDSLDWRCLINGNYKRFKVQLDLLTILFLLIPISTRQSQPLLKEANNTYLPTFIDDIMIFIHTLS